MPCYVTNPLIHSSFIAFSSHPSRFNFLAIYISCKGLACITQGVLYFTFMSFQFSWQRGHRMYLGYDVIRTMDSIMYTDTSTDTCTHTTLGIQLEYACLDVCLGLYALDVCLGFILRKIIFQKNINKHHSNYFPNKPWDQNPIVFSFSFS